MRDENLVTPPVPLCPSRPGELPATAGGAPLLLPVPAVPPPIVAQAPTARPTAVRTPPPARMLVHASEFRLNPSRRVVPVGRLIVQVKNIGEDDHNLAIRAANGHILRITPVLHPGDLAELRIRLKPGRYWLVCTIPEHEGHGMVTAFTVRKPAARRR